MSIDWSAQAFSLAWRILPKIPESVASVVADVAADVTWLIRASGVGQLEANLSRVVPGLSARELRSLSRRAMRSYFRYFREAFQIGSLTDQQLRARVRLVNDEIPRERIAQGHTLVLALGHMGNWDLAGQWSAKNFTPVTTVAERLKPARLFEEFVEFRNKLGMEILAFGDDGVFKLLQKTARGSNRIIPLLADRDLGKSGVEVEMFGQRARVAAGPAALAISTGAPLFTLGVFYEKLTGRRRRAARSRWGLVLEFSDEISTGDVSGPTRHKVQIISQRWVDALSQSIQAHPEDWHMLQKLFLADLDPAKYRAVTGEDIG